MSAIVILATFLAAGVEWVEALTIVLAVGGVKGWRSAFAGVALAALVLTALVAIFGLSLTAYVPIATLRTLIGAFLLLFGLKWLYKAILRSSGLKALHDEAEAFAETRAHLLGPDPGRGLALDWLGVGTAFNGVLLEGLEVVFIVVALGGLNSMPAAITGALASMVAVVALGVTFRRPLTTVPENAMKYVVGIMLTAVGTFFVGEGLGVAWWRADLSLLPLIATYGLASLALVWILQRPIAFDSVRSRPVRALRAVAAEVWGLFVDDSALATVALAAVFAVGLYVDHDARGPLAGFFLVVGVLAAIVVALAGAARQGQAGRRSSTGPATPPVETHAGDTSPIEA